MSRSVSKKIRKQIYRRQLGKCANTPNVSLKRLDDYECPLWISQKHNGNFDDSGYDIDHIEEYCISQDNSMDNLQALCKCCHGYKTKQFLSKHKKRKKKKEVVINNEEKEKLYKKMMEIYDSTFHFENDINFYA